MLTLPDTDTALLKHSASEPGLHSSTASSTDATVLRQRINRPTPWAMQSHASTEIAYRRSATGWVAAEVVQPNSDDPITGKNFSARTSNQLALDAPVVLNPITIAKPWGQEIWFSGIEHRGESTVSQGTTQLPLSAYLALAPTRLVRRAAPLLLKILDPNSTPETGCLYFETHNTKHEVYVVTHIDAQAWPNGQGAIRLGMDQTRRQSYPSDDEFRAAYLQAVQRYEEVRRQIDQGAQLHDEEQTRRADMEAFTSLQALEVGDVVQVAPHIPHSLQNGVRVFEFQTPTYERNIISFNQRVLTQNHWDSKYAVDNMSLAGPTDPHLEILTESQNERIERIVDFDDFEVLRATLAANHSLDADLSAGYVMLAILEGDLRIDCVAGTALLGADTEDRAALVPASAQQAQIIPGAAGATLLIARPKAHSADKIPFD